MTEIAGILGEGKPILERDAHEVGCYGLVDGYATQNKTGEEVYAEEVTRLDGPFHCAGCFSDAVHRACVERKDHFAHKARLSPVVARGETELHKLCKEEIRDGLREAFSEGKWECERVIEPNEKKGTPRLIPDVSGYIGGLRLIIEVQASCLTIPKIITRASAYKARNCAILWIVPLKEDLGTLEFRPRLYERYLHSMYYGRTYYWRPGDGLKVTPVHYGIAYRHIPHSEWHDPEGELQQAGGYDKAYKIVKKPVPGDRVHIAQDFGWHERSDFVPWNERKTVPALTTWQDRLEAWWNEHEQAAFERRYSNDGQ